MNKLLIVGLGNPGSEYDHTRHNVGFKILDAFAHSLTAPLSSGRGAGGEVVFESSRLAFTAEGKVKNKIFFLIKPTTFMNLSGKAVNYYLQQEKIPLENLLVITDDVALPLGQIRLRPKGSDGGHNGLKSINEVLGSGNYSRLRFGIGNEYPRGTQADYVLGKWTNEELKIILPRIELATKAIKDFGLMGIEKTMNAYNSTSPKPDEERSK
jgi:PTH1 family peptidyl-tRNA hydrolase